MLCNSMLRSNHNSMQNYMVFIRLKKYAPFFSVVLKNCLKKGFTGYFNRNLCFK